jgi:hypothetical protein
MRSTTSQRDATHVTSAPLAVALSRKAPKGAIGSSVLDQKSH